MSKTMKKRQRRPTASRVQDRLAMARRSETTLTDGSYKACGLNEGLKLALRSLMQGRPARLLRTLADPHPLGCMRSSRGQPTPSAESLSVIFVALHFFFWTRLIVLNVLPLLITCQDAAGSSAGAADFHVSGRLCCATAVDASVI